MEAPRFASTLRPGMLVIAPLPDGSFRLVAEVNDAPEQRMPSSSSRASWRMTSQCLAGTPTALRCGLPSVAPRALAWDLFAAVTSARAVSSGSPAPIWAVRSEVDPV